MIEAKNLVKRYGSKEALHGVSFTFEKGRVYGFLGPNGAGKSTTMNIITGCLAANEGEVKVNGYDIYENATEAKRCIGYLPEQPPLYNDMTPFEYLEYVGRVKGLRREDLYNGIDYVIEKTDLESVKNRLIKNLSKGFRQRVGIAQAILGDPEIIILDEPTVGLDPKQIIEIRSLIRELGENHTVILSSHILTEISEVCDYVVIIAAGKLVASDTVENLTSMMGKSSYIDIDIRSTVSQAESVLESVEGVGQFDVIQKGAGIVHARILTEMDSDIKDALFFAFAGAGLPIISMVYEENSLENVFLSLTEDDNTQYADEDLGNECDSNGIECEAESEYSDSEAEDDDYTPLFGDDDGGDN